MTKPTGMIPAIPTPMNEDSTINFNGIGEVLDHLLENGIDTVLVGGSNGEYSLMNVEERKEVIQYVSEKVKGKAKVMAGTGCHRTEDTIELTKFASGAGADWALVISPYYMQTSEQGIIDHYKTVAENADIGIVVYHYPAATNVEMSPELINEISQIDGVVGVKNTVEQQHTSELLALTKDNESFSVLTGFEHLIVPTLATGGHGTIGIVHNLVPAELVRLYNLIVHENNIKEAIDLNKKLMPLYSAVEEETVPGTVKAGLEALGLPGGNSRLPLVPATEQYQQKIKKLLSDVGVLKTGETK
ncbi:4-hydroxy-tetrahydrodipicolinate synthase [Natribacillus halophilus]|uniref:4-hydroxy-tetrahydrodipicolinate synthase n=1 Tax=Natribacillus halophilus TaxID=549003 RepID=A0A1G8Q5Q1_9BACI|nr:4-hydroxy-tetrahydrodipicolinate synthase [Natribacillus halophilus]SDI99846.1 4-hydroxy-tetrahydrodipicolinate synthase [Natribacillus halophilus]